MCIPKQKLSRNNIFKFSSEQINHILDEDMESSSNYNNNNKWTLFSK